MERSREVLPLVASLHGKGLTSQAFAEKWSRAALSERASYQQHFLDLCAMLNQPRRETENGVGRLEGWVALVTGASSGLGRAVAVALAGTGAGADVTLVARSEEDLRQVEGEVSATGQRALVLPVDLASVDETVGTVEWTVGELGRVDVPVDAAGTDTLGFGEDLEVEYWDRTLAVNLPAPFLLSKAVFPHMREAG